MEQFPYDVIRIIDNYALNPNLCLVSKEFYYTLPLDKYKYAKKLYVREVTDLYDLDAYLDLKVLSFDENFPYVDFEILEFVKKSRHSKTPLCERYEIVFHTDKKLPKWVTVVGKEHIYT